MKDCVKPCSLEEPHKWEPKLYLNLCSDHLLQNIHILLIYIYTVCRKVAFSSLHLCPRFATL